MPVDLKMAWRNIWRNPRRTILTVLAIAFASLVLVFMLSFQFGTYEAMINSSVKINTGHLQVQAATYQDKQDIRLVVPEPGKVGAILQDMPQVTAYTFRAQAFALLSSTERTYAAMVVGIDPQTEPTVSTIKNLIRQGDFLSPDDTHQALVGRLLARNLNIKPGSEVTLLGQGRDGSIAATVVTVKGIYSSGIDEFDRASIQIPLSMFQETFSMGTAVHSVVVIADRLMDVGPIKSRLQSRLKALDEQQADLAVLDWTQLVPGLYQSIQLDLASGVIMYIFLILVVAFSILNTFLMAIFERTREFGVLMAIGTTPGRLIRLLLLESVSLTLVGIVIGIIAGCLVSLYFQVHGIDISGSSEMLRQYGISGLMYPRLTLISALTGPAAVFVITVIAALYPALKIRNLKPVEALSHV